MKCCRKPIEPQASPAPGRTTLDLAFPAAENPHQTLPPALPITPSHTLAPTPLMCSCPLTMSNRSLQVMPAGKCLSYANDIIWLVYS
jgi:hypothetical protein